MQNIKLHLAEISTITC